MEVGDDIVLTDVLRVLLPSYKGAPVLVFRGEGFENRRRRTYGLSWTTDRAVAESFALGDLRASEGGSVLLETLAPAEAIIAAPGLSAKWGDEAEYLVDRRHLKAVRVIARYAQATRGANWRNRIPAR